MMNKRKLRYSLLGAALIVASALAGGPAAATVLGVKEIRVYGGVPTFVQIAELIATQSGTGTNVALASNGASAFATSSYSGSTPSNTIDGIYPAGYPNIWQSGTANVGEYLQVLLASPFDLSSVTIYGRGDSYQDRDLYNLFLYDATGYLLGGIAGADARTAGLIFIELVEWDLEPDLHPPHVPEPGAIGLVGAGAAVLGWVRRRRSDRKPASS